MKETFVADGKGAELIVVLHGLSGSPTTMKDVCAAAGTARPDADILALQLPFGGPLGSIARTPAESVAANVVKRIDAAIEQRQQSGREGRYDKIILIGHSFGAVIARKVAIIAHGERAEAIFEPRLAGFRQGREWAGLIERIVMLGGMSRGWSPAAARDWTTATWWTIGSWIAEFMALVTFGWGRPTIAYIRQGAPFIVQTRLQWLALTRSSPDAKLPFVVQLLGAADDLVAPDDSVDFSCDLSGVASEGFALVELPFTTHNDAYVMSRPTEDERKIIKDAIHAGNLSDVCMHSSLPEVTRRHFLIFKRRERPSLVKQAKWILFERVVRDKPRSLSDIKINWQLMTDIPEHFPDKKATNVVFVIHGIRDRGFWTQKIARVIKHVVEKENVSRPADLRLHFRSFTGSYGYFAMVPFVLPWIRRWKAEWLMDRYVEARAHYPNAGVSFVGHSNGTYLLSRALKDYPAAQFDRVVLAGSVVRRDFDWISRLNRQQGREKPQVGEVLNYVATHDWVVALLSKAFQPARFFDLGSAGHDGFNQFRTDKPRGLHESRFVKGSHSAALVETQWDDIARFIVHGRPIPKPPDADFNASRSWFLVAMSWISTLLLASVLWLVLGVGIALTSSVFGGGTIQLAMPTFQEFGEWLAWPGQALHWIAAGGWIEPLLQGMSAVAGWIATLFSGDWIMPAWRAFVGLIGWFGDALFHGRISLPSTSSTVWQFNPWRAAVATVYWWLVYIVATRF